MLGSKSETIVTLIALSVIVLIITTLVVSPTTTVPIMVFLALANLAMIVRICLTGGTI